MKNPEYTKPFDLEHAKAGAPYGCADGSIADILKYTDRNIFGTIAADDGNEFAASWAPDGMKTSGLLGVDKILVMLPLGFIDGKPVWVGDEFIGHADTPCVAKAGLSSNFAGSRWPAPAPVYPFTRMSSPELTEVFDANLMLIVALENVANAALRHAIDAGQVVLPGGKNDAAHDLAIADAAAKAVYNKIYAFGFQRTAYCDLGLDLPAIVAGVSK